MPLSPSVDNHGSDHRNSWILFLPLIPLGASVLPLIRDILYFWLDGRPWRAPTLLSASLSRWTDRCLRLVPSLHPSSRSQPALWSVLGRCHLIPANHDIGMILRDIENLPFRALTGGTDTVDYGNSLWSILRTGCASLQPGIHHSPLCPLNNHSGFPGELHQFRHLRSRNGNPTPGTVCIIHGCKPESSIIPDPVSPDHQPDCRRLCWSFPVFT